MYNHTKKYSNINKRIDSITAVQSLKLQTLKNAEIN